MKPEAGDYYDRNALQFFADTVGADMTPLYRRFLPLIPSNGHILDAGCGSGRDARAFRSRGYRVTAIDGSPAVASLASGHIGIPVSVIRLQDLRWTLAFDGIWACASLLHLLPEELPSVFRNLAGALRPGGILYASFKYGNGVRWNDDRRFTDLNETALDGLLAQAPSLTGIDLWISADRRPGRAREPWLNLLLRRSGAARPPGSGP